MLNYDLKVHKMMLLICIANFNLFKNQGKCFHFESSIDEEEFRQNYELQNLIAFQKITNFQISSKFLKFHQNEFHLFENQVN